MCMFTELKKNMDFFQRHIVNAISMVIISSLNMLHFVAIYLEIYITSYYIMYDYECLSSSTSAYSIY